MHSLLEDYLSDVAAGLKALPIARRNEELKEMRQHLLNTVIVNQEFGQSEEEAVTNAIEQFGKPRELAASQIAAWERGEKSKKRDLLKTTACAFVFLALLPHLVLPLEQPYITRMIQPLHSQFWITAVILLWQLPVWLIVGAVTGLIFPRRAVVGMALVILAWEVAIAAHQMVDVLLTAKPWHLTLMEIATSLRTLLLLGGPYDLTAILGTWAASRWQQTRRDRITSAA